MNNDSPRADTRRQVCRQELVALMRQDSGTKAKVARLLSEVKEGRYWAEDFPSFEAYCESELGMALRTAQHLTKTYRQCLEAGVNEETIEQIGWSKLALLAHRLTPTNRDRLLADAKASTHATLKKRYRQKVPRVTKRKARAMTEADVPSVILAAVIRASEVTQSDDPQCNLEYIAAWFLKHHPRKGDRCDLSYLQN